MIATTLAIIGLVGIFIIIGAGYLIYSLINRHNMNGDTKTRAIDVFLYLGIAISLVVSVTNLLQMIFAAIDRKFPDLLSMSPYMDMYQSDVRMAVASLVVMYPLYLILSWYVAKDISKFTYKRDLAVRKIMIYAALFITVCTLIGTLVSIIYTFLGGELSIRFGYKALAVFVVSLAVFGYYLYTLRRDYTKPTKLPLVATIIASLLVLWAVIWSVMIIGSPTEMRAMRFDNTRLSDLSRIQQEVLNQFNTTDKIPANLEELDNAFQGYTVPKDPVTGETYVYKMVQQPTVRINASLNRKELVTPGIFEICATFETVREYDARGYTYPGKGGMGLDSMMYSASNYYHEGDNSPFWNHGIGETCFRRVIESDMYYGGR